MAEVESVSASKQAGDLASRRPLSPHLEIYKPMLTTAMSITHRISGVALYFGTLLLAAYFIAAATDAEYFHSVSRFFNSVFGIVILFGFTWALMHHLLGGVRHAIWDMGHGMDAPERELFAQATAIGGLALTVLIWAFVLGIRFWGN